MDYRAYTFEEPESEVSLINIFWNLLDQWKAILLVALVCALALPGVKLLRDAKSYQAAQTQAAEEEQQAELPTDEAIEQILAGLTDEDRPAVEILVQQQKLVNMQSDYLDHSLLLNTDLANQRTLNLRYSLRAGSDVEAQPLSTAYSTLLGRDSSLRVIGDVIDPDASLSYISELVSAYGDSVPDSNAKGLFLYVNVILPDKVDADTMSETVQNLVADIKDELGETMGAHSLELFSVSSRYVYNYDMVNRKAAIVSSINSNNTAMKTAIAALTADQKAAFEKIRKLLAPQETGNEVDGAEVATAETVEPAEDTDAPKPPAFSKKFALIGFVLGVVMYAIAYVVIVVVRGRVDSADVLDDYTGARLLGDVYYPAKHRGLSALFHSKFVGKRRWGGKGDVTTQVAKAASTVESVCEHAGANNVHVLLMGGAHGASARIAADITSQLAASGIQATVLNVEGDVDEKVLLPVKNAIYCVDSTVKASDLWNLSCLCRSYDITQLGNLFVCGW